MDNDAFSKKRRKTVLRVGDKDSNVFKGIINAFSGELVILRALAHKVDWP
ncbi:hypothetical protein MUN46_011730 [Mesosutterella sp. AGMB02718]|uniref:Uncharacterized protein n=1 Tax=Mesosutterella faecium TaxID=2925194 RepID=A0ABT7IQE5_9BURK|nr:hypothetical protein [Mesosutterella sp. AGMB02718]MDL2058371.1 hypothetical protein [Mesosutterella sp. AGMB02718]MDL2060607.1 hypothetical protein [Mesosutterella sp. AGMB02718]